MVTFGIVRRVKSEAVPITHLRVSDPELLIAGIRGASLEPCQLSSQPAVSELTRVLFPGACLDLVHLGPAMLFSGAMPPDCYTLVFVLDCPEMGHSFNFAIDHTDGYMGFFPPGGELDAATPAGYRNATLTVVAADFHQALAIHFPEAPDELIAQGAGMRVGRAEQVRLREIVAAIRRLILHPTDPVVDAMALMHAGRNLLAAFIAGLRSGYEDLVPPPPVRIAKRLERLRRARSYLAAHIHEPIYMEDLCRVTALASRGLENLFQDYLGLGPTAFLRHQRLHGVGRVLQRTERLPGAVKQAARDWGFWHQGHFAHDYLALFGESPVETLARRL